MSIINCYDLNGMAVRFLTQWDHDVSIRITGVNADPIPDFRFSNKKSKKAICIKGVATSDSMMSIVPNELLREALPVYVQLFYKYPSGDAKTEHTFVIPVKPASMPDSEVYEPSEVKSLVEIEARLDRLERNGVPGSGGIPSNPTFDAICLGGDNGVVIIPEGAVRAPALTLYGAHGDEPVSLNNVADATDDRSVPNLGQVKRLMQQLEVVRLKVVHELPDSGEAMVLYLVPAQSSADIYTEYLWVDGAWEVVGSQTLDLTGYATEDWVEDYVSTRLEEDSGQNPSQGGTGMSAELKSALKVYFTNVQTLIGQTAYSVPNPVADIVIGNARAVLDALEEQPEQPDSGIIQSGSILAITSGVAVTQLGSELTIS